MLLLNWLWIDNEEQLKCMVTMHMLTYVRKQLVKCLLLTKNDSNNGEQRNNEEKKIEEGAITFFKSNLNHVTKKFPYAMNRFSRLCMNILLLLLFQGRYFYS